MIKNFMIPDQLSVELIDPLKTRAKKGFKDAFNA